MCDWDWAMQWDKLRSEADSNGNDHYFPVSSLFSYEHFGNHQDSNFHGQQFEQYRHSGLYSADAERAMDNFRR